MKTKAVYAATVTVAVVSFTTAIVGSTTIPPPPYADPNLQAQQPIDIDATLAAIRAHTAALKAGKPLPASAPTVVKIAPKSVPAAEPKPKPVAVVVPIAPVIVKPIAPIPTANLPPNALEHLPTLQNTVSRVWPAFSCTAMMAAQVEQETCISLKHRGCWNPRTELKTSREYGFGLGQLTIAYTKEGAERFNNFKEAKKMKQLEKWEWNDRYNPEYQLMTMVLTNKKNYEALRFPIASEGERWAFMLVAYNSGLGGILADRKLCSPPSCDPTKWWGNVEHNSLKAKKAVSGYGKSFFEISREYPRAVMKTRASKYRQSFFLNHPDHNVCTILDSVKWQQQE